ncbi:hypothetical protein HanPSC8_Chr11g0470091 [Helianthus annuus]|nr:hypothetical protein HanIR_Chr11g0525081 [Helianthus annuus]KAJ0874924.1 hypothetical protein HanPSC8_Chr11g0470091 [Helianthus annuus]
MWYAGSGYYRVGCMGFSNLKTDPLYFFERFLPPHNSIFSQTLTYFIAAFALLHLCVFSYPLKPLIRFFEVFFVC